MSFPSRAPPSIARTLSAVRRRTTCIRIRKSANRYPIHLPRRNACYDHYVKVIARCGNQNTLGIEVVNKPQSTRIIHVVARRLSVRHRSHDGVRRGATVVQIVELPDAVEKTDNRAAAVPNAGTTARCRAPATDAQLGDAIGHAVLEQADRLTKSVRASLEVGGQIPNLPSRVSPDLCVLASWRSS